jgi:hypothetical protein
MLVHRSIVFQFSIAGLLKKKEARRGEPTCPRLLYAALIAASSITLVGARPAEGEGASNGLRFKRTES